MKKIKLSQNKVTLVDDEDFEYLNQWNWTASWDSHGKKYYVLRKNYQDYKNPITIHMHRLIMNTPKGMICDHINGNSLDNRKSNLRNCTHAENQRNRGKNKNNTSGYKGVSPLSSGWVSNINVKGKRIYLGYFVDIIKAAEAYDVASLKYFGEFANLNFPKEQYSKI